MSPTGVLHFHRRAQLTAQHHGVSPEDLALITSSGYSWAVDLPCTCSIEKYLQQTWGRYSLKEDPFDKGELKLAEALLDHPGLPFVRNGYEDYIFDGRPPCILQLEKYELTEAGIEWAEQEYRKEWRKAASPEDSS